MLFHNVVCVCFLALLAPKIETNADLVTETERPEALFADVIKNISRVNTELQNLINNYEQFKKSQSSQEKFDEKEVNYLSDPEGGRVNRNKKNIGNQRVSSGTTLSFQTKMIFVGDESEESSQPEKNSEAGMNSEAEKSSQSELYSEAEKTQHNNEEEQSKEEPTRSMENTNKKTHKIQKATTEAKIAKEPIVERKTENQKNINIHNSIKTNKGKQIMPEPVIDQTFKEERYGEKETQGKESGSVSYAEGEHSVIEEEVASKLKSRASAADEDTTTPKVTAGIFLRSGTDIPNSSSPELTDNDVALNKDVFKTNILREAYGDACLKLVIRKCYKACKNTLKNSMRASTMKDKKEVKSYFKKKYKAACDEVFEAKPRNTSVASAMSASSCRRNFKNGILNKGAVTHNEYISMACQSELEMPIRRMLQNDTAGPTTEQVNILRDKYERACQRISQKKCRKACNNAKDETCQKFECQKRLKRNFKRNCKANCKRAYSSKSKSSDKDSHSDSDSDSGSDDDSDDESSKDDGSKSKS